MQTVTVYTEEDFIYEGNIKVFLKQDKVSENNCHLECYKEEKYLFGITLNSNIYTLEGIDSLIKAKFKIYAISTELKYSLKRFTYILQSSKSIHSVVFTASGNENMFTITYMVDDSCCVKNTCFSGDFNNLVGVRNSTDSLFRIVCHTRRIEEK